MIALDVLSESTLDRMLDDAREAGAEATVDAIYREIERRYALGLGDKQPPFSVRMMPGQAPYTDAERSQLYALVADAAAGDPGEAGEL